MKSHSLGWIQNSSDTDSLKKVVSLFVPDSTTNKWLREVQLSRLISDEQLKTDFIATLSKKDRIVISYGALKGKGKSQSGSRKDALCSGIIQAAIHGQGEKEYVDDWSSDCFLRWAISLGFLEFDRQSDTCSISKNGLTYVGTDDGSKEEKDCLETAYLSYPPAVRVLSLLEKYKHMTKFEIGAKLGIIGEEGFTSIPQNLFVQGLCDASTKEERSKIRQNVEGDSDKYARMICGWLSKINWVKRVPKEIAVKFGNTEYKAVIGQAYLLTLEGRTKLKRAYGKSSVRKVPKIVYWEMLATKPKDSDYLRTRRAYIIKALGSSSKTPEQIVSYLADRSLNENVSTVLDDLRSLENIGLTISESHGTYRLLDEITHLDIPAKTTKITKSDLTSLKDMVRSKLHTLDHKYLNLIDLSFNSKANRDFEIQTVGLMTNELDFDGVRLGESRKPDGVLYKDTNGIILDTKAYSKGYNLPIGQQDEMARYITENQERSKARNPNEWWKSFPDTVYAFTFLFVSSFFTQNVSEKIKNLALRTKTNGAAINSSNLLLLADSLLSKRMGYSNCIELLGNNEEIVCEDDIQLMSGQAVVKTEVTE